MADTPTPGAPKPYAELYSPAEAGAAFVAIIAGQQRELVSKSDRDFIATYLADVFKVREEAAAAQARTAAIGEERKRCAALCREVAKTQLLGPHDFKQGWAGGVRAVELEITMPRALTPPTGEST